MAPLRLTRFLALHAPHPPCPQIMEKRHNFLHRQALLVRASVEPLTDADWARLRAHSLGPTSLGDGTPGNNRWGPSEGEKGIVGGLWQGGTARGS